MVRKKGSLILCGAFLFVAWNALLLLYLWGRPPMGHLGEGGGAEPGGEEEWGVAKAKGSQVNLAGEVIRLAEEVEVQLETQKKLLKQIERQRAAWVGRKDVGKRDTTDPKPGTPSPALGGNKHPGVGLTQTALAPADRPSPPAAPPQLVIPVLVIACDRVTVRRSLDRLIQYRPSPELHPIIVSQDCGHAETARVIASYGPQVTHIRQPDLSNVRVRLEHRKFQGYYKIARHYRWALNQVFHTFSQSTVVIVEDDLEVSPAGQTPPQRHCRRHRGNEIRSGEPKQKPLRLAAALRRRRRGTAWTVHLGPRRRLCATRVRSEVDVQFSVGEGSTPWSNGGLCPLVSPPRPGGP